MDRNDEINDLEFKIFTLKQRLNKTDYKALKFAEGELTSSEYAETRAERKALRAEINALETKLNSLKG